MKFANPKIKLAKQVRYAKLVKPFFPKTYERIMEKKAQQVLGSCLSSMPVEEKQQVVKQAARQMDSVPARLYLRLEASLGRMLVMVGSILAFFEGVAAKNVIQAGEALKTSQYAGFGLFGIYAAAALAGGYSLIHVEKKARLAEIGSELRAAAESVLPKPKSEP